MWHVFNFLVARELFVLLIFVGRAFTCRVRELSSYKCSLIPFVDERTNIVYSTNWEQCQIQRGAKNLCLKRVNSFKYSYGKKKHNIALGESP